MTANPARSLARRCRAAVAVAGVLVVLLGVVPAGAAARNPTPSTPRQADPPAEPVEPPSISVVARPAWVGPEDQFDFVVRVTGAGEGWSVRVAVHRALRDVDELDRSRTEDVGSRLFRTPSLPIDELPTVDGDRVVTLRTAEGPPDASTVQITRPGIHPFVLTLHDERGRMVAAARTPVLRVGDEDRALIAPRVGVVLDVAAPPTLRPDGSRTLESATVSGLAPVGELLAAHPDLDLSTAIVPDTLEALATSTDTDATTLASRLSEGEPLLAPYLPVAVESLRATDLIGLLPELLDRGRSTLTDRVGRSPRAGVWDPAADLGDGGGQLLAEVGFDSLLVDDTDLDDPEADPDDDRAGPSSPVPFGPLALDGVGPLQALVVDTALSEELGAPAPDAVDAAEIALARVILADDGAGAGLLVRPTVATRSVLAGLLDLLDVPDAPVRIGGLGVLLDDADEPATSDLEWRGGTRPDLSGIAPRITDLTPRLTTFAATIDPRSPRADDLRLQLLAAVGATTPGRDRVAAIDVVDATVNDTFAAIRLAGQNDLNLTSRRGTLPVTVANDNGFPVTVVLRFRSDRLRFPEGQVITVTVTEPAERFDIPVEALATGSVPVFVELWTADDRVQLDRRQLNVRSTAISGVGLVLSVGALVVLLVWWVRSWRRTRADRPPVE